MSLRYFSFKTKPHIGCVFSRDHICLLGIKKADLVPTLMIQEPDTDLARDLIGRWVEKHQLQQAVVSLGLPCQEVRVGSMTLPAGLSHADKVSELTVALERQYRTTRGNFFFDYALEPVSNGYETRLHYVAAMRELLEKWQGIFGHAGLALQRATPDVLALYSFLKKHAHVTLTLTSLILHVTLNHVSVYVFKSGFLQACVQTPPLGLHEVIKQASPQSILYFVDEGVGEAVQFVSHSLNAMSLHRLIPSSRTWQEMCAYVLANTEILPWM